MISVLVFVSRDYELGTKFRLIVVYLLRKSHRNIEVSAFGNFSTDTGSTDCNQHKRVQISEESTVSPAEG